MARPISKFGWLSMVQMQPLEILDSKAKAVAAALVMEAERGAIDVCAAAAVLGSRSSLHRSSVVKALGRLESDGWLRVRRLRSHRGRSRTATNTFTMTIPGHAMTVSLTATRFEDLERQTVSLTATRFEDLERPTVSLTATVLRGKNQGVAVSADEEAPIRGEAVRAILEGRWTADDVGA